MLVPMGLVRTELKGLYSSQIYSLVLLLRKLKLALEMRFSRGSPEVLNQWMVFKFVFLTRSQFLNPLRRPLPYWVLYLSFGGSDHNVFC